MKVYWPLRFSTHRSPFLSQCPILKGNGWRVSLNRMEWDVEDNFIHDHGCDFFSVILRGGYVEEVFPRAGSPESFIRKRRRFSARVLRGTSAHRLLSNSEGTITLFVTFNHLGRPPWAYLPNGEVKDFISAMKEDA